MDIFGVLSLIGGLALFLYGMNVMGAGLEKMSGGKLERVLEKMTSNPIKAVLLGAGVTAIIQSSSATTVMVVGFVNSGIMKLSQAIGIIMGANIGTTITSWLLSLTGIEGSSFFIQMLKPSSFAPILALLGVLFTMAAKSDTKKNVGTMFLGFAVLMQGMETMTAAVEPLADVPEFTSILTMFNNPLLGILSGALLTGIIQSSAASIGILQALTVTGGFTYNSVVPIILGQNIGTCVTAMLSSIGANKSARRTAFVHLYFNLIGSFVFLALYFGGNAIIGFSFANEVVGAADIALVHTIFNFFTTLILLPFTKGLEKLAYMTLPLTEDEMETSSDVFAVLDERFLNSPAYAIEQCRILVNQMAELTRTSFVEAMEILSEYSEDKATEVVKMENQIDTYNDKISAYLTRLNSEDMSVNDSLQVTTLLHCITDIERISDHAINVVESAQHIHKKGYEFSKKAVEELTIYGSAIEDILNRTTDAFVQDDQELARTVEPLEDVIDTLNKKVKKHHMKRLNKGKCTIELGLVLSDLAMNYERVSDHCSNIAVYMLQLTDAQLEEHSFTEQMDARETAEFARLRDEFKKKYEL